MTDAELLKAIDNHSKDCSSWEAEFVASCLDQLPRPLSPRQRAKAEEILERLDGERE